MMHKYALRLVPLFLFLGCGGGGNGGGDNATPPKAPIQTKKPTKYAPFYPVGSETVSLDAPFVYSFLITDGQTCRPYWDRADNRDWRDFNDTIRTNGIVSFGGAGAEGRSLAYVCDDAKLLRYYEEIVDTYHVKWLDFDIEGGMLSEDATNIKRFRVLERLLQERPDLNVSLTLPVMPEGLNADTKRLIQEAKEAQLLIASYNLMLMNYGEDYPADDANQTMMYRYSRSAIEHVNDDLKAIFGTDRDFFTKLGAVAMIGKNDVANEIFYPKDFSLLKDFVRDHRMALLSFWSIIRDKPGSDIDSSSGLGSEVYGNIPYRYFDIGRQ